jgi:hypothetical protein
MGVIVVVVVARVVVVVRSADSCSGKGARRQRIVPRVARATLQPRTRVA